MRFSFARLAYFLAFLAVVGYATVTLRGPRGLHALFEKKTEIRAMEERNERLAKEIERKREHIKRLADNPAEQELEIRDRLKLVNPKDKVFITGEPQTK